MANNNNAASTNDSSPDEFTASSVDLASLSGVVEKYRARLRRMIAARIDRRVAARIDPSDVIQETIIEAARRFEDYQRNPTMSLYPWLRQIARDRLVMLQRVHLGAQKRSVTREESWFTQASSIFDVNAVSARELSPSGEAALHELQNRVREALLQLSENHREVIVLRHIEQLSLVEIAEISGMTLQAAKSRYRRAVERLHDMLEHSVEDLM